MSKKPRRKAPPPKRPPRSWLFLPLIALLIVAAWWFLARTPAAGVAPGTGAALAAHRPADLHPLEVSPVAARTILFGHHHGMLVSHERAR